MDANSTADCHPAGSRLPTTARKFCALVVVLFMGLCLARAQEEGTVSGVVLETWNGSPLAGATVSVRGTTLATQTDAGGRFELKNVPPGDQVLRFSRPGYASVNVTDVRVSAGQTTAVNGNLRPEFYEMEEYEVTVEEFTDQTAQILEQRKDSSTMLDGIGGDFMRQVGAGDAAEALSKVAGASIADGKFAVIRGLADRYTATTLNGNDLPSADPDRKAAQLDLLPVQVIDRMDVAKTFSPDMSGGFAGGAINIVTKGYPDKAMASLTLGTSYNTQSSLNKNFLASDRSSTDWLAIDDGKRALPGVALASSPSPGGTPIQNEGVVEQSFGSSRMSPLPDKSPLNAGMSLAFGDSFKRGDFTFGFLASLTFKNEYKFYDDGFVRKYDAATLTKDMDDALGLSEYSWSASTTLGCSIGEHHHLQFNFLYVQAAEDEARQLQGYVQDFSEPGTSYAEQDILHWTQRNLMYFQLAGEHDFPDLKEIEFDWATAVSSATQEEPDYRIFQFLAFPNDSIYYPQSTVTPTSPTRYWRNVEENNLSVRGDFTIPLPSYNSQENAFKLGGALSDSARDFFQRGYEMYWSGSSQLTFLYTGNPQDYLAPTNYPYVTYRNYPVNIVYNGAQTITAAYGMADWAATEWMRLIGGLRWEYTDLTLSGVNQTLNQPLESGNINQGDLLPSVSAVFTITDKLQLRAAWSQTVVRPTYREIAPVYIYDIADGELISGNPDLIVSDSANYDLRLEYFPRAGEILSLSLFMKQIENPIELIQVNPNDVTYENSEHADVYGVEVEFRTSLDRVWEGLEEFTLGGNAAYIYSEVPISPEDQRQRYLTYLDTSTSRPLYDQPDYVVNADLTWNHPATGTAITVVGGLVGPRLVLYGLTKPDEYQDPAPQLDVFVTQALGKHWKLKFAAKNLLNPEYQISQVNAAAGYQTQILKSYTKGITFGLGLSCEF